ncbi:MAG TPA: DUF979 domain-containing protein [Blastocatellia bacterium]|nr:DUF979 domain-containing protein [Blastocatellia bacterium]
MQVISSVAGWVFSLQAVYVLVGLVLVVFASMTFRDRDNPRRVGSGLFWVILGLIFIAGGLLPHWLTGMLVLLMVALDGTGQVRRGSSTEVSKAEQEKEAARLGNKIFLPVLVIPLVTFAFAAAFKITGADMNRGALVGLGFGGVAGAAVALRLTRSSLRTLLDEGRRINDAIGPFNILPQLLASMGIIFAAAKIGGLIAGAITRVIPQDNLFLLVLANCAGMTLLTIIMGNSFAAFPVIAAGVLVPLIVQPFGVDPAMAAIITLTAGSSGTLMTPMAANFNIVPAVLLDMRSLYGVIKFQLPFALTIWSLHVLLMYFLIKFF